MDVAATEESPKKVQAKQPKSSGNGRNKIGDGSSFIETDRSAKSVWRTLGMTKARMQILGDDKGHLYHLVEMAFRIALSMSGLRCARGRCCNLWANHTLQSPGRGRLPLSVFCSKQLRFRGSLHTEATVLRRFEKLGCKQETTVTCK